MSELSCRNCNPSACCHDVRIVLSENEVKRLEEAGTTLNPIFVPEVDDRDVWESWADEADQLLLIARSMKVPSESIFWTAVASKVRNMGPDDGVYSMEGDCGFLREDGLCGDYASRPDACRNLSVGSRACLGFREDAGISITNVEIRQPLSALTN